MVQRNRREHYLVRAETSRRLAAAARDPLIGMVHSEMARLYEATLAELPGDTITYEVIGPKQR